MSPKDPHVHTCGSCGGFLVEGDRSSEILSLSIDELRAKVDKGGRRATCVCGQLMDNLIVDHSLVELCFSCGALFLDAREAKWVSSGRLGAREEP